MNAMSFGTAARNRFGVASGEPKPEPCSADMAWLVLEAAVERLDLEARDLDQPFPLGTVEPPEGDRIPALERDVKPVVVLCLVDPVPHTVLLLPLAVDSGCDSRIEDEGIPGEAAAGSERRIHALEHAPPVRPGRKVEQ